LSCFCTALSGPARVVGWGTGGAGGHLGKWATAPGVGCKTEGGAERRVGRGVTTLKAGRSVLTVDGAEGLGVLASASPSSSVVSMSPLAGAEVSGSWAEGSSSAGGRRVGLARQVGSVAG